MAVLIVVAIATHFFLTRAPGAHHGWFARKPRGTGVNVNGALAYVISGTRRLLGIFYAAQQEQLRNRYRWRVQSNALAAVVVLGSLCRRGTTPAR